MEFEIKGKEVELRFGIGFIRRLDEIYTVEMHGVQFGAGMTLARLGLEQFNPSALADVIYSALNGKYTNREVDAALEEYADKNGGLGELFERVDEEMGKSPITKETMDRLEKQGEKALKEQEAEKNTSK